MNMTWVVFLKELLEALRDRRTMITSFLVMPIAFPLIFAGINAYTASKQTEKAEKRLELPVEGAANAPNLMRWLKQNNVEIKPPPADIDAAIRNQDEEVALRIGADYPKSWRASEPALVEVIFDSSRPLQSGVSIDRVRRLLSQYSQEVATLRQVARGLHPAALSPLRTSQRDLSTPETKFSMGKVMLPYLLILLGFIGGMHLAIDSTAGERERQSLEPLLATPASREAIVSGKMLATALFSLVSLIITLFGYKYSFSLFPNSAAQTGFDVSLATIGQLFVVISPIVLFGASLLTALAAFAKSYREAQGYIPMLMFVPMIPTLFLMSSPVKTQLWMLAVPFLGQNQMIVKLIRGEHLTGAEWGVGLGGGVILVLVTWFIAARLYRREQLAISV